MKHSKKIVIVSILSSVAILMFNFVSPPKIKDPVKLKELKEELGREMFFDKALSNPDGESCATCHAPRTAFADVFNEAFSEGIIDGRFANRNSPGLTYSRYTPSLYFDEKEGAWMGGLFWDGRSNNLEHQLSGPLFAKAEMNNTDTAMVVAELPKATYYKLYKQIYGKTRDKVLTFQNMMDALAHFERSNELHEFSSKFDYYLAGQATLNDEEKRGMNLFNDPTKGNCASCHTSTPDPVSGEVLFTNFHYENLGVPRNEDNKFYTTIPAINPDGKAAIDYGLGKVVNDPRQNGKFRVPTLRNVKYTAPYFHNGYFKTLEETVHFINTRERGNYAAPEISETVNRHHTGDRGLNEAEEKDIIAFLLTLSDGYNQEQ